jgi:hypothetical protein
MADPRPCCLHTGLQDALDFAAADMPYPTGRLQLMTADLEGSDVVPQVRDSSSSSSSYNIGAVSKVAATMLIEWCYAA